MYILHRYVLLVGTVFRWMVFCLFVMVDDMRQQGQALDEPIGLPIGPYKRGRFTQNPPMGFGLVIQLGPPARL